MQGVSGSQVGQSNIGGFQKNLNNSMELAQTPYDMGLIT